MNTIISKIDIKNIDKNEIKKQAELIKEGKTVIFPTETVYGLGANALDENAVKKIYEAKGRPSDNPLIVHIYNKEEVYNLTREGYHIAIIMIDSIKLDDDTKRLLKAFTYLIVSDNDIYEKLQDEFELLYIPKSEF